VHHIFRPRHESFHRVEGWYDHPLPNYNTIAADMLHDLVTLTFGLLTLFSGHTWRITWSTPPPSLKILRLSVLELRVLTSPIVYHWQCVCSHCGCAVSRDLCVGANFSRIFEICDPDLPIRYTTFMALRSRQIELFAKIVYGPALKNTRSVTYSSLRMRKITSALNAAVNLLPPSFSATTISR